MAITNLSMASNYCAGYTEPNKNGLYVERLTSANTSKTNAFIKFQPFDVTGKIIKNITLTLTTANNKSAETATDVFTLRSAFNNSTTISNCNKGSSSVSFVKTGTNEYNLPRSTSVANELATYGVMLESAVYGNDAYYTVSNASLRIEWITNESENVCAANIQPSGKTIDHRSDTTVTWNIVGEGGSATQSRAEIEIISGGTPKILSYNTTQGSAVLPPYTFNNNSACQYRVRLTSNYGVVGDWSSAITINTLMQGKAIVTALTPSANNEYSGKPVSFTWQIAKQVDDVVQTSYIIEKSINGTQWEQLVNLSGSGTSYSLPANQLIQGTYYWRMRVNTNYGLTEYSNVQTFKVVGTPKISNAIYTGDMWERDISLSWLSEYQVGFEYELYQNNNLIKSGSGGSEKAFTILANTFSSKENANCKIRVKNISNGETLYSDWATVNFSLRDITATISSLLVTGDMWEKPIELSWLSENQEQFKVEVLKDNVVIKTYTGTTDNKYTIASNELGSGVHSFKVWVGYKNRFVNYSSKDINLKDIEATISNLLVTGDMWEKPISLSWLSENQEQFKVEALKNNVVVKTYTGTTAKNYTIASNELSEGLHTFKVWVGYKGRYVNSTSKDVTLKNVYATIDNVSVSGSNIDLQLALSWVSENQDKYEVQILKGEAVVKTYSGTTAKSLNIPPSTLTTGVHIFKVRVAYKDRWTEYKTTQVTLSETLPSIGVLEPDGRIVDRDTAINVYWTSQNQTSWSLVVGGNTFTGTSETSKLLPIGLLYTGRQSMTLTVTLSIAGKNKTTTKTVEFIVQGKPPVPTFTNNATFTTNRPTFSWDSQDCQAYELSCGSYSTGWVNGLVNTCKINDYLPNGSYTARLRVKNQYNIASDYSTQQIVIAAAATTPTTLKVYNNDTLNTLKWDMTRYTKAYVLRNGERIALAYGEYTDNTCQGENVYQILCVTDAEVATQSNKVVAYNDIDFPVISDGVDMLELIYRTSRNDIKANYSTMSSKQYYSGRKLPITRHGEHEERTYSFDYAELGEENFFRLLEMVARKKPLLYRSHNKKLWLTFDSISYNDNVDNVIYSINAYEVDMSEVVDYE